MNRDEFYDNLALAHSNKKRSGSSIMGFGEEFNGQKYMRTHSTNSVNNTRRAKITDPHTGSVGVNTADHATEDNRRNINRSTSGKRPGGGNDHNYTTSKIHKTEYGMSLQDFRSATGRAAGSTEYSNKEIRNLSWKEMTPNQQLTLFEKSIMMDIAHMNGKPVDPNALCVSGPQLSETETRNLIRRLASKWGIDFNSIKIGHNDGRTNKFDSSSRYNIIKRLKAVWF